MGNYEDAKKFNGVCFSILGVILYAWTLAILDANVFLWRSQRC